jgi:hypothetical protein
MEFDPLYKDLANGPQIITSLLAGISQVDAQVKSDPAAWSFLEVICHLYDEEREDFRVRLDIILHRPAEPWPPIRPQEWVVERKYNEQNLERTLEKFKSERANSLAWLKNLTSPDWETKFETPWGSMKAGDMLSAWVAHDNLHTRQLVELRRSRIVRLTEPYRVQYAGDW